MKSNYKKIILFSVVVIFVGALCLIFYKLNKTENNSVQTINDIDDYIDTDDGDEDIDWSIYQESNLDKDNTNINKPGIYILTGDYNKGIVINTKGNVKLILNGSNIKSNNGPCILVEEAENTLIYLEEGTTNTLEDSLNYNDEVDGVIYSRDDLIIDGTGVLEIKSNYLDGIVSNDDLKIINGNFNITSNDDSIRGKDSVYIIDGIFNINANGDGIKSTNDTDTSKGYILIEKGTFNIDASLDGIQAEIKVVVNGGEFNIKTGGGSSNGSTTDSWGKWGRGMYENNISTDSAKGIKAISNIVVYGGKYVFDTADDAIHSNDYVGISNGNISISSGDDGIHADTKIIIESGEININKSYEGIEASEIIINNGNINLVSSDDGINVAGGNDNSSMNRPGENNYNNKTNNRLIINDGYINIDARGDGIDVNGSSYVYGGEVYINGPTDNGNGILDYDKEFVVDGGILVGTGSNGMLQSITSSKQYNVTIAFNNYYDVNSKVQIIDSNNNEILSYIPSKRFSALVISSPNLVKNETYTIKVNDKTFDTFKTTNFSTFVGNSRGMMPGGDRRESRR